MVTPLSRALLTAAGLSAVLAAPAAAAPATVTVANKQFGPSAVTIAAGETVTWKFNESGHDVAGSGWSGNTSFATGTFTRTFPTAGTFSYVCEAHSSMRGTVTVTGAGAPAPAPSPAPKAPAPPTGVPLPVAADVVAPSLAGARATLPRGRTRARLSVRVSEDAWIGIVPRRVGAGKAMAPILRHATKGANRFSLKLAGLHAGRYRLQVRAVDAAGNWSPVRRVTLRVAGR
ncbi:MAG TPA: plastocyanin/azurin family copper-binding protein [Solirubrobacteraceae bacterium]|jgi:plastocyanin|nr:plastocyanin/azurin family copper-binding protein [Solirubrobacteraceae bacterium]